MNRDENFQIMNKGTDFVTVTLASEDAETGDPKMCFNLKTRGFLRATSGQAGKFWSSANLGTLEKLDPVGSTVRYEMMKLCTVSV